MANHSINFQDTWIGKYHFRKLLGRGAFASVWLADECNPNREVIRPVAIKVFVDDFADRESFQNTFESFQVDLRFLADLAPDNPIIQYYNSEMADIFVGEDGVAVTVGTREADRQSTDRALTAFLIVMEYADGGSLGPTYREEVVIQRQDNSYLDHFIDICTGLRAAHLRDTVHRDIKPRNLMWFKRADRVKIGDFGIAKHLKDISPLGVYVTGTPPYMSPESFDVALPATPERDIYALGCTFYEILTGDLAFSPHFDSSTQSDPRALLDTYQAIHQRSPRPDAVVRATNLVSVKLSTLIRRMMSVAPQDRPTLDEVIRVLREDKGVPFRVSSKVDSVELPNQPIQRSVYNINPIFRREQLKETTFFIFLTINTQTHYKYKLMFTLLEGYFGDTYSVCELFGRYDFLIRVWSTRQQIMSFCEKLIDQLLDDNRRSLHIMAIDEVTHLGANTHIPKNLSVAEILVKLNDAQTGRDDTARDATRWLQRNHIYVRKLNDSLEGHTVKCFCLVSQPSNVSQNEREANGALMIRALEHSIPDAKRINLSVYRKAYQLVERLENERSDYLISYVAPTFNDVARVPSVILDDLTHQRFRVITLLASKRYYADSDNVQPQPQRPILDA